MEYVLFIGSKLGYEALDTLIKNDCNLLYIFIEKEHEHEAIKYYRQSIKKCEEASIEYFLNPSKIEIKEVLNNLLKKNHDIHYIMSFGYRKMISEDIAKIAKIAALGTHFSPLPRYRGFAPLNWVLINGESETAVNLFYLDKEVDNGDIIATQKILISHADDINTLFEKCIIVFRELMNNIIPKLEENNFLRVKQDSSRATYTCARNPEDGRINWKESSKAIYNLTRALTFPYPGAFTFIEGKKFFIWSCEEYEVQKYEGYIPGKVIKIIKDQGVIVLCGKGAVLVKDIELENGKRQTADKLIKSIRLTLGV